MSLPTQLSRLERDGLIKVVATQPELEYIFRHILVQDAAYSSLLRQQRARWHLAAAEALEAVYRTDPQTPGGVPDTLAPILAHHYATGGDVLHAQHYYTQAGEAAFARYANVEAAEHFSRALRLLLDQGGEANNLRDLYLRLGRAYELSHQLEAALQLYAEMEATAQRRANPALRLAALMARATVLSTASLAFDEAGAQAALEQARGLARDLDDHAAEAHINWTLLLRNTMVGGDPDERLALGEAALRSARALGLREQLAYVLTDLWYAYGGLSRWADGLICLREAAALWRALGNPTMLSEAFGRMANTSLITGDYAAAQAAIGEAYAVADQINSAHMRGLSRVFAGPVAFEQGHLAAAIDVMEAVIALGETTGNITALIGTRAELALAYGFVGAAETGRALAAQALEAGQQFDVLRPWAASALARLCLQQGDIAAAERHLAGLDYRALLRATRFMALMWGGVGLARVELALGRGDTAAAAGLAAELVTVLEQHQVVCLQPEALTLHGRALLALGELDAARAALQAARVQALQLGARRHLWTILAALAEASPDDAEALGQAARVEVAWLVAQVPPALRGAFQARPPVARWLSPAAE